MERRRQYNRDSRAARKRDWQILIARKDGYDTPVCVECGLPEIDPHNPLQCSHNNPATKSFNLSRAIAGFLNKTQAEIEEEARKCSLRHFRCHSTFDNGTVYGPDGIPHGLSGYTYHGCRCPVCVAAVNKASRENKRNRLADPDKRKAHNKVLRDRRADPVRREADNKRKRDLYARQMTDPVRREAHNKKAAGEQERFNVTLVQALLSLA